jgi:toxin CcdB
MKQFDVYANTDSDTNQTYPYFVDVQTELLEVLNSRVVIPLTTALLDKGLPNNICPKVEIIGEQYYLLTHQITTVSRSFLRKHESSLLLNRTDIINSLDFLISGI